MADGKTYLIESQPITVQEALQKAGVTLNAEDKVSLPLLKYVYDATVITVKRVRTDVVTEDESITPARRGGNTPIWRRAAAKSLSW